MWTTGISLEGTWERTGKIVRRAYPSCPQYDGEGKEELFQTPEWRLEPGQRISLEVCVGEKRPGLTAGRTLAFTEARSYSGSEE